jgi:neutral ceramidase
VKTGISSTVITPPIGVVLGGNGREDSRSRGIHDDLRANVIYLDKGKDKFVFVGLDLLAINQEDCEIVRSRVEKELGIPAANIMIFATHTHSGPNIVKIFLNNEQESDELDSYRVTLRDKIVEGIKSAFNSAFEGKIAFVKGNEPKFSHNRRVLMEDGSVKMIFEDYDHSKIKKLLGVNGLPDLNIFLIADDKENLKALLINYASHPACICGQDWLYSRDYVNYLTNELQKEYGKDLVVVYANGPQGNLVWSDAYDPFVTGFDEAEKVGKGLSEAVVKTLKENKIEYSSDPAMKVLFKHIKLPSRKITNEMIENAKKIAVQHEDKVQLHGLDPKKGAIDLLRLAKDIKEEEDTVIQAVILGDCLILTFPGEVFVEFALEILKKSKFKNTMLFGLANSYVGYIPIERAFNEGGYEVKTSMGSRCAPQAGNILTQYVIELADSISK